MVPWKTVELSVRVRLLLLITFPIPASWVADMFWPFRSSVPRLEPCDPTKKFGAAVSRPGPPSLNTPLETVTMLQVEAAPLRVSVPVQLLFRPTSPVRGALIVRSELAQNVALADAAKATLPPPVAA